MSWKDTQTQPIGTKSDFKQFKTQEKAEVFGVSKIVLVNPASPLRMRSCTQICLSGARQGWLGSSCVSLRGAYPHTMGPQVVTDPQGSQCLGADRPTNNTGKISAFYHAFTWALDLFFPSACSHLELFIQSWWEVSILSLSPLDHFLTYHPIEN